MVRRKLIMKYLVGINESGKEILKKVTLNVRSWLNEDQLRELVANYSAMTSNVLVEAIVVDERVLDIKNSDERVDGNEAAVTKEVTEAIPMDLDETNSEKVEITAFQEDVEIIPSEEKQTISLEKSETPPKEEEPISLEKCGTIPKKKEEAILQGKSKVIPEKEGTALQEKSGVIPIKGEEIISLGKYGTIPKKKQESTSQEQLEVLPEKEGIVWQKKSNVTSKEKNEMAWLDEKDPITKNGIIFDWEDQEEEVNGNVLSEETIEIFSNGSGLSPKEFVKPVQTKKMKPPVEKGSKSSKKKKKRKLH